MPTSSRVPTTSRSCAGSSKENDDGKTVALVSAVQATASAPSRSRIIAAFAAVYVVWGSTYLAIRYAVESMPPFLMAAARFIVSGAILYAWARAKGSTRPTPLQWRDAAITGVLMLCFGNGLVGWAEQRVPSGLAALLVAVVPLWMVLIDWVLPRGIRPRGLVIAGVLIGFAGLAVLVRPGTTAGDGSLDRAAALVLIGASFAWACGSVFNRYGARPDSAALSTGLQMLGGSVGLVAIGVARGETSQLQLAHVTSQSWIGWLYLVSFGSLVGFTAYIFLLRTVSPAKASTYAYVNPLVAVFLGWAIAGESITTRTLRAAAIILAGVAMITASQGRAEAE
jgi:drug/metabolite transporter (DMT)-like permease